MDIEERHILENKKTAVKTLLNKMRDMPDDRSLRQIEQLENIFDELMIAVDEMLTADTEQDPEVMKILRELGQLIYKVTGGELDLRDEIKDAERFFE